MSLVNLAEAAGFALPFLVLLWTAAMGLVLQAAYPPPCGEIEEAVIAASFTF